MAQETEALTPTEEDGEALRKTLEQMREKAEQEVVRLHRRLAEREFETDSSVATATEKLAMQQEMVILQQTLEAKEQALDHITTECRRLEDELEDQNMAIDGLKQEIDRREKSLQDAFAESERLRLELVETRRMAAAPQPPAPAPVVVKEVATSSNKWIIAAAVGGFVLLSAAMLLVVYLFWDRIEPLLPRVVEQETPAVVAEATPAVQGAETDVSTDAGAESPPTTATTLPVGIKPKIGVDRLRGGASGPAIVALPGGVFQMGSNSLSGEDFSPAHEVQIAPFYIGVSEVTYTDYDRFARATGRPLPSDFGWGRGDRPVVGVSWDDAVAYAAWLTRETGRHYRLPSEAEWEYAARAGTTMAYWWGPVFERRRAICFDCGTRWDNRSTAPVTSMPTNPFGLYGMGGNATEWVLDCYRPSYRDAPVDGSPRVDGTCSSRVARGAAFNKPSGSVRVYARSRYATETRLNSIGFRIARDS